MAAFLEKLPGTRALPILVMAVTLSVLGGGTAVVTSHLGKLIRRQILQQDGEVLYAASLVQNFRAGGDSAEDLDPAFKELFGPEEQLLDLLEASKIRGVIAVRLFNSQGELEANFPPNVVESSLDANEARTISLMQPVTEFLPHAELTKILSADTFSSPPPPAPLIRVLIPTAPVEGRSSGVAEFFLDGENIAKAFAGVDRQIWQYGLVVFLVGGAVIGISLGWAFRRLQKSNRLLEQRTQSLLKANHELTLSAKTSAIGAITAHLIHDLKNPLFGLQSLMSSRTSNDIEEEEWNAALNSTQRMQKIIGDVVRILQEDNLHSGYEITMPELAGLVVSKLTPAAREAGIELRAEGTSEEVVSNRIGNIVTLIITNIVQNAIQACSAGCRITIQHASGEDGVTIQIRDTGPGLPDHIVKSIFTPCRSNKTNGTGLGLAISKQLSMHLGADLNLEKTSSEGTTFKLRLPKNMLSNTFVEAARANA